MRMSSSRSGKGKEPGCVSCGYGVWAVVGAFNWQAAGAGVTFVGGRRRDGEGVGLQRPAADGSRTVPALASSLHGAHGVLLGTTSRPGRPGRALHDGNYTPAPPLRARHTTGRGPCDPPAAVARRILTAVGQLWMHGGLPFVRRVAAKPW